MNGYFDWKLSEIQQLQTILKGLDVNLIFNIKKFKRGETNVKLNN